jgi:hypothetical protein
MKKRNLILLAGATLATVIILQKVGFFSSVRNKLYDMIPKDWKYVKSNFTPFTKSSQKLVYRAKTSVEN